MMPLLCGGSPFYSVDRLLPAIKCYECESYCLLKHHQMGEHATHPITGSRLNDLIQRTDAGICRGDNMLLLNSSNHRDSKEWKDQCHVVFSPVCFFILRSLVGS